MTRWAELPVVKVDGVIELEHAVVDGIDISGSWNRMFIQRSITEYPTEAMDWVTGLDGGESMRDCYQCGKCVPVCPVNHVGDYGPRKLNVKVLRGNDLVDDPGSVAVHDLRQLLPGLPQGGQPAPDHARDPRAGGPRRARSRTSWPTSFQKLQRTGNPLGESPRKRADWSAEAGVAGAAHRRARPAGGRPVVRLGLHLATTRAARTRPGRWPGS